MNGQGQAQWTKVEEIRLFKWMTLFKPAGVHKHFHMVCLLERMNKPEQYPIKLLQSDKGESKVFSAKDIWERLQKYYDLEKADAVENRPYDLSTINKIQGDAEEGEDEEEEEEEAEDGPAMVDDDADSENGDEKEHSAQNDFNEGGNGAAWENSGVRVCMPLQNRLSEGQEFELSWEEYGDLILEHAKDNDSEDLVENDIPNDHIKVDKHVDEDVKHRATEKIAKITEHERRSRTRGSVRASSRLTRSQKREISDESENQDESKGEEDDNESDEDDIRNSLSLSAQTNSVLANAAQPSDKGQIHSSDVKIENQEEQDKKESTVQPLEEEQSNKDFSNDIDDEPSQKHESSDGEQKEKLESSQDDDDEDGDEDDDEEGPRQKRQKIPQQEPANVETADSPAKRTRRKSITRVSTRLSSRLRSRK